MSRFRHALALTAALGFLASCEAPLPTHQGTGSAQQQPQAQQAAPAPEPQYARYENTDYDVTPDSLRAVDPNVTSLVIIADTSGSMGGQKIRDLRTTLDETIERLHGAVLTGKKIEAGLIVFKGDAAEYAVPFGEFNYAAMKGTAQVLEADSNTPLGYSLALAKRTLDTVATGTPSILMATDGQNTRGEDPSDIYGAMRSAAQDGKAPHAQLYVVAYDTPMSYFEQQLQSGLDPSKDAYVPILFAAGNASELSDRLLGSISLILEAPDAGVKYAPAATPE